MYEVVNGSHVTGNVVNIYPLVPPGWVKAANMLEGAKRDSIDGVGRHDYYTQ